MKNINYIKTVAIATMLITFAACKPEPPVPPVHNEQEVITVVKLLLIPQGTGVPINYSWSDSDGVGGKNPVFDTLRLLKGKVYDGDVSVYNTTTVPTDTLTDEIEAEKNSHQFFYTISGIINNYLTLSRLDTDNNGLPVGLKIRISSTNNSGTGKMNIRLSHYDGVAKTANPSNDTDLDIDVPVKLE